MKDRKTQVLDAAARLISQQGYSQTSVDDVIRASGLSGKSHFYHYFRSKEELGYEVLNRQFERLAERGVAVLREPLIDPLERLFLFIDSMVALQAERGCKGGSAFANIAAEMADSHEGFRARIAAVFERWAGQLEALLWELRPRLREGVEAERLARFIIATLEGALLMSRVERDITVMQGIADELKGYVSTHLRDARASREAHAAGDAAAPARR